MENLNNKITLVTPTLNSEKFLEQTILSIITQKGDFYLEYIIVDGQSTDNTGKIIKYYEDKIKNKEWPLFCRGIDYKWISGKDSGMYDALNKGFALATGYIMTYINSDDLILPGACETVRKIFRGHNDIRWLTGRPSYLNRDGLVHGTFNIIGYDREKIRKGYYRGDCLHFIQQEGTFWTRELWEKSGRGFSVDFKYAGDFELWLRFAGFSELYTLHSGLGAFRRHGKQLTSDHMPEYYRELDEIKKVKFKNWWRIWFFIYKRIIYHLGNRINFDLPYLKYDETTGFWLRKN